MLQMYIEVACWWAISLAALSWPWFVNLVVAELPSSRGSRYIRIPFGTEKEWIQDAHRVCFPGLQGWRHRDCVSGTRMGEFLTHRLLLHIHVWHHLWPGMEWLRIPRQTTVSSIILDSPLFSHKLLMLHHPSPISLHSCNFYFYLKDLTLKFSLRVQESVLRPVPLLRSRGHIPSTCSICSRVNGLTGKTFPLG